MLLGSATNPNNRYIHSGWPSADGLHLVFHDELEEIQFGLSTQIYTLSLANLRAPTVQVSMGSTTTTDHNGYMRGSYYYVSHYRRGVVVYDPPNPTQLVEVAHFDNYVTPSTNVAGTDGTWGIYPFLPSGNLLVSDIENGLFVLRDHVQTLKRSVGRVGFRMLAANGGSGGQHSRSGAARRRARRQRQRAVRGGGRLGHGRCRLHWPAPARCLGASAITATKTSL